MRTHTTARWVGTHSRWRKILGGWGLLAGLLVAAPVAAQNMPPDVPPNHWAYQAVHDLADKGLVKGYPDGKFLGKRTLTRYEMATLIQRLLQTVDEMVKAATPPPPAPPREAPAPPPPPPAPTGAPPGELKKNPGLV